MSLYVYCVVKSLVVCFLNAPVRRSRGFYITCENEYGTLSTKQQYSPVMNYSEIS